MMTRTILSPLAAAGLALAAAAPVSASGAAPGLGTAPTVPAAPAASTISLPFSRGGDYLSVYGTAVGRIAGVQGNTHTIMIYVAGHDVNVRIESEYCVRETCAARPVLTGPATVSQRVSSTTRSTRITGTLRADLPGGRVLVPFDIPMYATSATRPITTSPDLKSWARSGRIASGASLGRLALHNDRPSPAVSGEYGRYRYTSAP